MTIQKMTIVKVSGKSYEVLADLFQGQLWEECERCNNEPVYMPTGLCEKCVAQQFGKLIT